MIVIRTATTIAGAIVMTGTDDFELSRVVTGRNPDYLTDMSLWHDSNERTAC